MAPASAIATAHDYPIPKPTELSRPFWEAANDGRLVIQRCDACGAYRWTPQILCTRCQAEPFTWERVSGVGTIYSFTIVHRAPTTGFQVPFVLAVVELVEGPMMLTQIVDCDPGEVEIGSPVEIAFTRANDDINLYTFALTRAA
jgi:uncharacterized OB-fold protein